MKDKKNEAARNKTKALEIVADVKKKKLEKEQERAEEEEAALEKADAERTKRLWTITKVTVGVAIAGMFVWALYEYNKSEK